MGNVSILLDDSSSARLFYDRALLLAEHLNEQLGASESALSVAEIVSNLGVAFQQGNDLPSARDCQLRARATAEQLDTPESRRDLPQILCNLGKVLERLDNLHDARD